MHSLLRFMKDMGGTLTYLPYSRQFRWENPIKRLSFTVAESDVRYESDEFMMILSRIKNEWQHISTQKPVDSTDQLSSSNTPLITDQ